MNVTPTLAVPIAIALWAIAASTTAQAGEIEVYRSDHERPDCRMVETRTTNRWGNEVTIRQRMCD